MTIFDLAYSPLDPAGIHPRDAQRIARITRNILRAYKRPGDDIRHMRKWSNALAKANLRAMRNARDIVARDPYAWSYVINSTPPTTVGQRMTRNLAFCKEDARR
jgi:hypothetical protein